MTGLKLKIRATKISEKLEALEQKCKIVITKQKLLTVNQENMQECAFEHEGQTLPEMLFHRAFSILAFERESVW